MCWCPRIITSDVEEGSPYSSTRLCFSIVELDVLLRVNVLSPCSRSLGMSALSLNSVDYKPLLRGAAAQAPL